MNYRKICKHCRSEIDAAATTCPVCHKQQGLTKGQQLILLFLGIPLLLILMVDLLTEESVKETPITITGEVDTTKDYNSEAHKILEEMDDLENLSIEGEVEFVREKYSTYFSGIVKNNTRRDMSYVSIEFNLYDKDNNLLGSAWDNVSNLKAGGTWKFKAHSFISSDLEKTIATWEIIELDGY